MLSLDTRARRTENIIDKYEEQMKRCKRVRYMLNMLYQRREAGGHIHTVYTGTSMQKGGKYRENMYEILSDWSWVRGIRYCTGRELDRTS